ncbi:hypothetical protein ACFVHB_21240 [Kitasatospora sp. NPDC127111]|uniref:hypothetical protein n=1 Tax=Kitasatospora sp. NPDC127111 TaxID=3345363 RepID=UPI00362E8024
MTDRTDVNDDPEALGLCVVANVARETGFGEGGLEIRSGLRHFAPGAKVWLAPPRWWNGNASVMVAGRHRGNSRRYVTIAVPRRALENFRVRAVHSPGLHRALGGGELWTAEDAEHYLRYWALPRLETTVQRAGEDFSRTAPSVTDPPPMELEHEGTTYYLAHFNANRARYSTLPPPVEPSPPAGD